MTKHKTLNWNSPETPTEIHISLKKKQSTLACFIQYTALYMYNNMMTWISVCGESGKFSVWCCTTAGEYLSIYGSDKISKVGWVV